MARDWSTTMPPSVGGGDDSLPSSVGDGRYTLLAFVAQGSSSRVFRGLDTTIGSTVAIKLTPAAPDGSPSDGDATPIESGFRHPYLVRKLDEGIDRRWAWEILEFVEGRTFADLMTGLGAERPSDEHTMPSSPPRAGPPVAPERVGPGLEQALYLLSEAAMGLGAAHRQARVHLDLKPDNIMFEWRPIEDTTISRIDYRAWLDAGDGVRQQIQRVPVPRIIDWGLGRRIGSTRSGEERPAGVPHYMAPERIVDGAATPAVDVYALGAILFHLLTGRAPFDTHDRDALRRAWAEGADLTLRLEVPSSLGAYADVCRAAIDPDPRRRPADGEAFGRSLRRARFLCLLADADALLVRSRELAQHALSLREQADAMAQRADPRTIEAMHPVWALQDKADEAAHESAQREAQWVQNVRRVLAVQPDLPEARARIIDWGHDRLREAERRGDARAEQLVLEELRADVADLTDGAVAPWISTVRDRARALLGGRAELSLTTSPGVEIAFAPAYFEHRRLTVGPFATIGRGQVERISLDAGRGVLRLTASGHEEVRIPVRSMRGDHWRLDPPGADGSLPLDLPRAGTIGQGAAWVAPGWAWIGGQRFAADSVEPGRWVWIDGFVMQKNPTTNEEWLGFLDHLSTTGRHAEACRYTPRAPARADGSLLVFEWSDVDRRWTMARPDLHARWPVSWINWYAATAYAAWRAEVDHLPWRLPSEWEYEKAARCGDERRLPWGEHLEPRWTRISGSTAGMYRPAAVDAETGDVTVHGIRWLVGNVQTWCLEPWSFQGPEPGARVDIEAARTTAANPYRMVRGCAFFTQPYLVSGSTRFAALPDDTSTTAGVRLVRSLG